MHSRKRDICSKGYRIDNKHDFSVGQADDWSDLSLRELLQEYRRHLARGACFFLGKYEDDHLVDICEIHVPFSEPAGMTLQNVIFAFFEKGYPESDLAEKGYEYWWHQYPFAHHEASTGSEFQDKLAAYIRARLLEICRESR